MEGLDTEKLVYRLGTLAAAMATVPWMLSDAVLKRHLGDGPDSSRGRLTLGLSLLGVAGVTWGQVSSWPVLGRLGALFIGCGPSLCRYFATLQRKGQQTLPPGQLQMSPCLKLLVFLAPQCGSARAPRTAPHRRARTVALGSWELGSCGAEELGAEELRSWERKSCGAGKLRKRHKGRAG